MGIRDSILSALGRDSSDTPDVAIERVRKAMLDLVDEFGGVHHVRFEMKINYAREIAELWYLRPELMHMVSEAHGEEVARKRVDKITALFKKHQLGGKSSRFGAL